MSRRKRMAQGASGSESKFGGCIGYGFFGIFALAGLGAFVGLFVMPVLKIVDARSWTETRCSITSSHVESVSSDDGTTYRVAIKYTYQADGTSYTGDRYDWSSGSSSGYDGKRAVVDSMPEGSTVACFYDPDMPSESVIRRGAGWFLLWGLFALPFMAVGFGGLFFLIKAPAITRKASRMAEAERSARVHRPSPRPASTGFTASPSVSEANRGGLSFQPPSSPGAFNTTAQPADDGRPTWPDHPPMAPAGQIDLEPNVSRTGKLIGALIFSAIWNGLIGLMIWKVFEDVFAGRSDDWLRFETFFFIPFVLIGLLLILFVIHTFLSLFNPVAHLQLGTGGPEVGTRFPMQWRLTGSSGRLRSLVIRIEGRESATYRRGTNTTTDRHTFYEEELVRIEPVRVSQGSSEVILPAPSLPTWSSNNNKIQWRLLVQGDIPFWPDVSEDFPIEVSPPAHLGRRQFGPSPVGSKGDEPEVPGSVEIELDRIVFEPGEVVEGTVRWSTGGQPAESVLISLLWHTEGKGTEDTETVAQTRVDTPSDHGEHRFALQLESQPWSFSGTLVSVQWIVEASLEPNGDLHRVVLISAPGGQEVRV
ncbi:MAG: DUF3592 domain-containing protein [Thermoanaerobaculia bacterium]|nr:DUF3592 domain-containing protein [Thermoanaerobaculia bacterium]